MTSDTSRETLPHGSTARPEASLRRFRLSVVEGPGQGLKADSDGDLCTIGQDPLNHFVLPDPTVSRFHCEVRLSDDGARVKDVGSLNGVTVDGTRVLEAFLRTNCQLRLGATVLKFEFLPDTTTLSLARDDHFGSLTGHSQAMRHAFSILERASRSQVTVLLEGETGTGKSQAARALHEASSRKECPFLIVDCAALPATLLESELFGHEKGAFTGALTKRAGVFEEADGGTVFLDEIGELPLELQPKLLHVLEEREVRPLGSNQYKRVDVRVITATHRDLRAEVNAGRFRSDLFFRLAVARVSMPALRERPDDLPVLVDGLLTSMGAPPAAKARLTSPQFLERLRYQPWPGNVRELRNFLERCLVFEDDQLAAESTGAPTDAPPDASMTFSDARRTALDTFERRYVTALLEKHGAVTKAAEAADIDRVYLHRLIRKHGITRE